MTTASGVVDDWELGKTNSQHAIKKNNNGEQHWEQQLKELGAKWQKNWGLLNSFFKHVVC
jgi:hypothetical protein